MTWAIISTVATIIGIILGIARLVAARRKAKVDKALGQAEAHMDVLQQGQAAAEDRIRTDAAVTRLPDSTADQRLDKWMRD